MGELTKKEIMDIIRSAYRLRPRDIAAFELYAKGVTEVQVAGIDGPLWMRVEVANRLRDLYRKEL